MPKRLRADIANRSVFDAVGGGPSLGWTVHLPDGVVDWTWAKSGAPPVRRLLPLRRPTSSKRNRHIPATAYSMTTGGVLELESGLEHDLVRHLDRDPQIDWIVAQPFRLSWEPRSAHTPDLLTLNVDGALTVWDARAPEKQDDAFRRKCDITRAECSSVGWRYEVFSGFSGVGRANLLWLHGFRRYAPWAQTHEPRIRALVGDHAVTLGELFAHDDGSGELKSAVWQLLWRGVLSTDMGVRWDLDTEVTVGTGVA